MNDLLKAMSSDMKIPRYQNESDESFVYRLCYSALGQWCLSTAMNSMGGVVGTTKHNQTIVLNELLSRYGELFPQIAKSLLIPVISKQVFRSLFEELTRKQDIC